MNRRTFGRHLAQIVIAIPAAKWLAACDDNENVNVTVDMARPVTPTDAATPVTPVDAATPVTPVDAATPVTPVDAATPVPMDHTYTSTASQGHTHQITLEGALFANPPETGIDRATTIASGHDHMVSLSRAELQSIADGGSVTKTTTVVSGHSHQFTFVNT